jgi:hypothetical protein
MGDLAQGAARVIHSAPAALNALNLAMDHYRREAGKQGLSLVSGGYFGGNEDKDATRALREYEQSLSSKAKEDVIRKLASALSRVGIQVDPHGDLDAIVKALKTQIPDPRTNKTTYSAKAADQKELCKAVATTLNSVFSPGATEASSQFIDVSLEPVALCRQVAEWVHSFE